MFDSYRNRLGAYGGSERSLISEASIKSKELLFDNTQSFKKVIIDGETYDARITQDVSDTVKTGNGNYTIEFRHGVMFYPGTYVEIENVFGEPEQWLIIDVLDNLFFNKSLIKKCNYPLKWKNADGEIITRMIAFDDSYKIYDATRNYGYKSNLPEGTIVIILPYDSETVKLRLDDRLIVDAEGFNDTPDTYMVSNRNAVSRLYDNEHGIVKLSLTATQFNYQTDNAELMVADYYGEPISDNTAVLVDNKQIEITYRGSNRIVMGTPFKEYTMKISDDSGELDEIGVWSVDILPEFSELIVYEVDGNTLKIKSDFYDGLRNYQFRIGASDATNTVRTELYTKVVTGI